MGCLLSVCGLSQLACCAGSTVCSLFSCCMPSNAPKVMYSVMFFLVTLIGWIMVIPNVSSWLKSWVPFCWGLPKVPSLPFESEFKEGANKFATTAGLNPWFANHTGNSTGNYCDELTGYTSVYRLMFAATMFFTVFGIIMINTRRSNDCRVGLHRGLWGVKFLLLAAAVVGAFFIPASDSFSDVWKVFGLIGAFCFLLIQFMLVIIFADDLAAAFHSDENERSGMCKLAGTAILSIVTSFVGFVLYYIYYSGCGVHNFVITINWMICVALCICSVLPAVQERQIRSGLTQSTLVSLYIAYLTWSALNSSPHVECKPTILSGGSNMSLDWQSFFSMVIAFACILYSSIRISSDSQFDKITGGNGVSNLDAESVSSETRLTIDQTGRGDDDENEDRSNWSYFYFIFALGTLYMMMTLTNWYNPSEKVYTFGQSASAFWIKIASSWCCAFLYFWTLVAPLVLGQWRDFDY